MDYNKQFDALQESMKNFNINVALDMSMSPLCDTDFIINKCSEIIELFGNELTIDNFKKKHTYFNFLDQQLLIMAQSKDCESMIFDFVDLINFENCKMTSAVLIAVTAIENTEEPPNRECLKHFLSSIFDKLIKMNDSDLQNILPIILKHLLKIKIQLQKHLTVLYYFARISYFVLRVNFDPIEFIDICSNIIYDPYLLLEFEFDDTDADIEYLASFYYLYFKTEKTWGPKVYNPFYILEKCLDLALPVFKNDSFGKTFVKMILSKFDDDTIQLYMLKDIHKTFVHEVAHSSMYDEECHVRKESIETLTMYMDKLCSEPQYVVFRHIFRKLDYSIKAELIIKMKDVICLKITSNQSLGYFQGNGLLELINTCCIIPDGSKCHVVDNKEYILAVITVIYVLYKHHDTVLDMGKPYVDKAKEFVQTVQSAIDNLKKEYQEEAIILNNKKYNQVNHFPEYLQMTISNKKHMLTNSNNAIAAVQMQLNLLKDNLYN